MLMVGGEFLNTVVVIVGKIDQFPVVHHVCKLNFQTRFPILETYRLMTQINMMEKPS